MRLLRIICVIGLAAGLPLRALACSQCMCGAPFPADVLGGVVPSRLTYGLEERYLSKENALSEEPGEEHQHEHRIAGIGLWRPMDRVALLARVPYNFKEIVSTPSGGASSTQRNNGLGDAELSALLGMVHTMSATPTTVGLVLGVTAPTGSNNAKDESGVRLDEHLQPGAGAWSGTAGANVALGAAKGTWDASLLGRANGENSHGYHYGNAVLYNAGFISQPLKNVQLLVQVNGRYAKRDRLQDGSFDENTGGTVTYASPGLRWSSGFGLIVEGQVQLPIQQSLYGDQTEHTTGRLTLTYGQ